MPKPNRILPSGYKLRMREQARALREDGGKAIARGVATGLTSDLEESIVLHSQTMQFVRIAAVKKPDIIVGEAAPAAFMRREWGLPTSHLILPRLSREEILEVARNAAKIHVFAREREKRVKDRKKED